MITFKTAGNKHILLCLLLIFLFRFAYGGAKEESRQLFDDSQVALINITIDSTALEWIYTWENRKSDSMHVASLHFKNAFIDENVDSIGFRLRGNTSRDAGKKSFKLSFNTFIAGRQFYGVDKLNLNGEHNDPSIIRSKLCWDVYQKIGMKASRAAHAAVYINGKYYGLYIMVEHIDDEFLDSRFTDESGNLWKCLWPADLTYRGDEEENYYPYFDETRPYELKTNKDAYDYRPLARFIRIINQTPDSLFEDSLTVVLKLNEILKYFAVNILSGSWDDYWFLKNNYYLYYEPRLKIFHWIPYDYDNTFGVDWFGIDWSTVNPYVFANHEQSQGQPEGPRPLAKRIMRSARFRNLYSHFLKFYMERIFSDHSWFGHIDSLKEQITPWAEADTYRTLDYNFSLSDFNNSYTDGHYSNQHVKFGLKEFINRRVNSLEQQIEWQNAGPIVYELDWYPKRPGPEDSIFVSAAIFGHHVLQEAVIAWHPADLTVVDSYPMQYRPLLNSNRVEDADRWRGVIPALGNKGSGKFQISVMDSEDNLYLYPNSPIEIKSSAADSTGLVINEFLAKNDHSNADAAGEFDDWLELFNTGPQALNLAGMYLSDDPRNLKRWRFPDTEIVLDSKSFLLVWCDNDPEQSGWHTNFKLSAKGESILLTASDGISIVDSLSYGLQQADISFGRTPDGAGEWNFMQPTPGSNNIFTSIRKAIAPRSFKLDVYPNPFNNELTISFHLDKQSAVLLQIFDSAGQLIWRKKAVYLAETHMEQWQACNLRGAEISSGIYFLRMKAGGRHSLRKVVLLK